MVVEFLVHISSCGRHLAALLHCSRLVVIRDFDHAARENISIYDLALEVQLGSPCYSSRYLAYENGRIAVATVRTFLFTIPCPILTSTQPSARVSSLCDPSFQIPIPEQRHRRTTRPPSYVKRRCPILRWRSFVSCLLRTELASKRSAACK